MKEYILMNPNGDIALGIKLMMYDNVDEQMLCKEGMGKISWLPDKPDFMALATSEGAGYMVLPYDFVMKGLEIIGEL